MNRLRKSRCRVRRPQRVTQDHAETPVQSRIETWQNAKLRFYEANTIQPFFMSRCLQNLPWWPASLPTADRPSPFLRVNATQKCRLKKRSRLHATDNDLAKKLNWPKLLTNGRCGRECPHRACEQGNSLCRR